MSLQIFAGRVSNMDRTIKVTQAEYEIILRHRRDAVAAERLYDMETGWKHREQRSIDQCGDDYSEVEDY